MKKTSSKDLSGRLNQALWVAAIAWTLIVLGLFFKDATETRKTAFALAKKEALSHFNKDHATRLWAATHGGVYVPVTEKTPPNPYLYHVPERDVVTPSGRSLTLMNPAYMLRELMTHYNELYGIRAHITGLKHFREETSPDRWEKDALLSFEEGRRDVWEVSELDGIPHLRFMKALITEKDCLRCHQHQGHEVGDIRGGVSVSVPLDPYLALKRKEILKQGISLGILWVLGLGGLALAGAGLKSHMLERQKTEDLYTSLVEDSLTGIYILHDGKVVFGNRRFAEIYGYSAQEVLGMDSLDFVHPEDRALIRDMRRSRAQGKEMPSEYEARGLKKNGDMIWVQRRNTLIDYEGKPAILGNVLDISLLKKAESELRFYATQLEHKNRELEDFASIASHDLQEPLRKIRFFGEMLLLKAGPVLDPGSRDAMERMQNAASRMSKLIQSLLTYSRVATKAQPFKPVDLNEIVRTSLSNLEIRLKETNGEISVDVLPVVEADEDQMIQLFQNLIGNALKFRQEGVRPHIRISLNGSVEGRAAGKPAFYEIRVEDNGIGFDPKWGELVFQPFERLHGRGKYEGSGMGLAICRKIAERHGGSIKATGVPGKGSTFTLKLPADGTVSPEEA